MSKKPVVVSMYLGGHRARLEALARTDGVSLAEMVRRLIDAERARRAKP